MSLKIIKTDMPFPVFSMEADHDYLLARMIHFFGGGFHARAGYFAQQACEKYLKALSVQHNGSYAESHKLLELAAICEPHFPFLGDEKAKSDLSMFDRAVFNIRRPLNFAKANFGDSLQAILREEPRDFLNATWRGPIPLKDILTRDNFYFRTEPLPTA